MSTEAPSASSNVTQLPTITPPTAPREREIRVVNDPIAVLDTGRFEHMQRIATVMANSNLIPDHLCMTGSRDSAERLPFNVIMANCFLVTNQAVRWEMDPFAVAQCVSVVHGKLCYEGKLIAAVLQAKLGIDLEYEITGQGEAMKVVVGAAINGKPVLDSKGRPKTVEGTVADWKTTGAGSPWSARGGPARMLRYRGAREWMRVHSPGMMLGVYSDDEMEDLSDNVRASHAREISPPRKPPAPDDPMPALTAPTEAPIPMDITPQREPVAVQPAAQPATQRPPAPDGLDIPANLDRRPKKPTTPSTDDPEAFLQWIDTTLASATGETLEATWNDGIAPRIDALLPPDQEEAVGIYRKHERRVA